MKAIKTLFFSLFIAFSFTVIATPPLSVFAEEVLHPVCVGIDASSDDAPTLCKDNSREQSRDSNEIYGPNGIITKAVRLLSIVIGVAAVIVIIIAGFKYILSAGDSNSVNSAKNTILYAVIGLVVAVLAQAIIIFFVSKL